MFRKQNLSGVYKKTQRNKIYEGGMGYEIDFKIHQQKTSYT